MSDDPVCPKCGKWYAAGIRCGCPPALADFLLARIAEDEDRAEFEREFHEDWPDTPACDSCNPARVLADVAAKRAIVSMSTWISNQERVPTDRPGVYDVVDTVRVSEDMEPVLFALATIWADHEDFDESWRP